MLNLLFFLLLPLLYLCTPPFQVFFNENQSKSPIPSHSYRITSYNLNETGLFIEIESLSKDTYYKDKRNRIFQAISISLRSKSPGYLSLKLNPSFILQETPGPFELPEEDPYPNDLLWKEESGDRFFSINIVSNPFSLEIFRSDSQGPLFSTKDFDLIISEKYLELTTILPSQEIFGLGESNKAFKLNSPGLYTLWNRDLFAEKDDGKGGKGSYSSHPVYLAREKGSRFHIVYLRNPHAMDIELKTTEKVSEEGVLPSTSLTYRVIGGVFDFRFFFGETPDEAIILYHRLLGGHILPPYWAFGYQISKYGIKDWMEIKEMVEEFNIKEIPLDIVWFDIDYMQEYRVFTVDEARFPLEQIKKVLLEEHKKHLVIVLDPGVAIKQGEAAYEEGIAGDFFIKTAYKSNLIGCVWPGKTHYPDFISPKVRLYWEQNIVKLYEKLPFSGLWIDMNEFSNLVNGMVSENRPDEECLLNRHKQLDSVESKCGYNEADFLVYTPGGHRKRLDEGNLCTNAVHLDGRTELQVHNLNGLFSSMATFQSLKGSLKRKFPFVLSRSTGPGSGKYAFHWTGDNRSGWDWLKLSLSGILDFQLFGIPFVGADVCGFAGEASEELCLRWTQVGSIYPFFRNHNFQTSRKQDPFSFSPESISGFRNSIFFRYSLLRHFYSVFVRLRGYGAAVRALFFEFGEEEECYEEDIREVEVLWGRELLFTPVLEPNERQIHPYFPGKNAVVWFGLITGESFLGGFHHRVSNGLDEPIPGFLRGGTLVFRQEVSKGVQSSRDLGSGFFIAAAFLSNLKAEGGVFACKGLLEDELLGECIKKGAELRLKIIIKKLEESLQVFMNFYKEEGSETSEEVDIEGIDLYGLEDLKGKKEGKALKIYKQEGKERMEEIGVRIDLKLEILSVRYDKSIGVVAGNQIIIQIKG